MPVVSRKTLRRQLGLVHVRDTYVGRTTASWGQAAYSLNIIDANVADLAATAPGAYVGAWLWLTGAEVRVASFNAASGAYVSAARMPSGPPTPDGFEYERHDALSPSDKNRALDDAVRRLRVRREVAAATVDGARSYPLLDIEQVLDAYYFATPSATLDRGRTALQSVETVVTATGAEVRITPALGGSRQLVFDAILPLSLGAADEATVSIPDERLVLFAAEAKCWDLLVRRAPRGTADEYRRLRDEAARQYDALARAFKIPVDRPLRLGETW